MGTFSKLIVMVALAAVAGAAPVHAQETKSNTHSGWYFDLHPQLTQAEFDQFTREIGEALRSRQLGDTATVPKGRVEFGVQVASASIDEGAAAWTNTMSHPAAAAHLGRYTAFPRVGARFGVADRVDVGVSGGFAPQANYGLAGVDTKVMVLREGDRMPVSLSIRPSVTVMFAPSEVWAGTASADFTISRTFKWISPYAGIAASTSEALARSNVVNLKASDAGWTAAFVGVSVRWRSLVLSGEVEDGDRTRTAFSIGTRF